jgi:hypothetical protein
VPATGAGVERLFNSARDICHYRRGSLNEKTIQDLMMYMCSQKFTLDNQQLSRLEKLPPEGDIQVSREEEYALKATEDEFDPISDFEEDEETNVGENSVQGMDTDEEVETEVEVSRVDRPPTCVSEELEENGGEMSLLPPPIVQLRDRSQKRSSGRATMPSSRLQGYELY